MHVSAFVPHQCSSVHIQVRDRLIFIHMRVLSPNACGTTWHIYVYNLQHTSKTNRNSLFHPMGIFFCILQTFTITRISIYIFVIC